MKKKFYLILLSILFVTVAEAQTPAEPVDTSWKIGGFLGITFSQVSLSNWATGGDNSISLGGNTKLYANYAKDKTEWATDLVMNYAMVRTEEDGTTKSDDRIDLNSKYGHKISDHWLVSALINFKSQFAAGYDASNDDSLISDLLSPGYFTAGVGMTWKPVEYFEVFMSPATAKLTFVENNYLSSIGAYGVDTGETMKTEFGAYLNFKFRKDIMKNVNLNSKLELFYNYSADATESAKGVDVNWDTYLDMKINDFLTASLNVLVVYDADVLAKTQVKEIFGIGLGYKFPKVVEK
jgi:hypothetical protein